MADPMPSGCGPSQRGRDPDRGARACAGFTLMEMMAALVILLFGVVALIGAMTSSIAQRRTADARHELTALVDKAVHRAMQEAVKGPGGNASPSELKFEPLVDQTTPGFPGMTWSASAIADENRPELWLVKITVKWFDASEEVTSEFLRVVPRQLPLRDRVSSFRGEDADGVKR
jgi:prepilin-type N-terminal cleavage/methylation domain-containing protein